MKLKLVAGTDLKWSETLEASFARTEAPEETIREHTKAVSFHVLEEIERTDQERKTRESEKKNRIKQIELQIVQKEPNTSTSMIARHIAWAKKKSLQDGLEASEARKKSDTHAYRQLSQYIDSPKVLTGRVLSLAKWYGILEYKGHEYCFHYSHCQGGV